MKIKALQTFVAFTGQMNVFNRDDTGELPDDVAAQYIESGHAVAIDSGSEASLATDLSQLDHDNDGAPGGSTTAAPSDDLAALRARYKEVVGKNYFAGWDAEELQKRIDAHVATPDNDGAPGGSTTEGTEDGAEDDAPAA